MESNLRYLSDIFSLSRKLLIFHPRMRVFQFLDIPKYFPFKNILKRLFWNLTKKNREWIFFNRFLKTSKIAHEIVKYFFLLIALIDENVLITSLLLNPMFQTLKQVGRNGGRMMEYQDLVSGVFFLIIQGNILVRCLIAKYFWLWNKLS